MLPDKPVHFLGKFGGLDGNSVDDVNDMGHSGFGDFRTVRVPSASALCVLRIGLFGNHFRFFHRYKFTGRSVTNNEKYVHFLQCSTS